jgi:hypothetical protein
VYDYYYIIRLLVYLFEVSMPSNAPVDTMIKAQRSLTLQLLPDCLGPDVPDADLDQELKASASYTEKEPIIKPIDAEQTAIMLISASQYHAIDRSP